MMLHDGLLYFWGNRSSRIHETHETYEKPKN